jgi:lipopolysaccharide biosynthesis regulator YciM
MTLGNLYESEKEWKESLKIYRTMLLQNADQSGKLRRGDIYIGLARAHIMLEEKPKAKAMLRRGLEEDASHPELGSELKRLEE